MKFNVTVILLAQYCYALAGAVKVERKRKTMEKICQRNVYLFDFFLSFVSEQNKEEENQKKIRTNYFYLFKEGNKKE